MMVTRIGDLLHSLLNRIGLHITLLSNYMGERESVCQSVFISAYCLLVTFSVGSNDELTVPSLHVQSIMRN